MKIKTFLQAVKHLATHGAVVFSLFIAPIVVSAATTDTGSFVPLTQLPGLSSIAGSPSISVFLNYLYKLCIGAAAVIAVLQIMRAGVEFMTNKGSVTTNEAAKSHIQNAIFGLILVLSPAIVFGIINPSILNLDLNVSGLHSTMQTATDTSTLTALQQKQAAGITKKQVVTLSAGQNPEGVCSALGSGWAGYDNQICSLSATDSTHRCCGYNPADDKSTPTITTPDTASGKYSYGYYLSQSDYSSSVSGAKCYVSGVRHFSTSAACNADITKFSSGMAIANNCDGKTSEPFPAQMYTPAGTYSTISNLPPCN